MINKVKKEIEKEEWDYWKDQNLIKYLEEKDFKFNKNEFYELIHELIKEDIFGFLHAIANSLSDLATDDDSFINLIESIVEKIKADLAQGPFIDSLIQIGKSDSKLGLSIAKKLLKTKNPEYSSFLIGGAASSLFEESKHIILNLVSSTDPRLQLTGIRALRVIFKDSSIVPDNIFSILENVVKVGSIDTKVETLEALLDFYEKGNKTNNKMIIEELAKSYTECKFSLAHRIWVRSPFDENTGIHFLELCAEDSNINLKKRVLYALVHFTKNYPERVLQIIAKYIRRDGYDFGDMGYVLSELGKVNAVIAINIILKLIDENDSRLKFHIPVMIKDLVSDIDKKIILEPIFKLIENDTKSKSSKGLDILLEIISEDYEENSDPEITSRTIDFLNTIAKKYGIDTSIVSNESNKVLQCADLIHLIKYYSQPINYDIVFRNLNEFPNILETFGSSWFEKKQQEGNRTHPILKMLQQKIPEKGKLDEQIDLIKKAQTDREKFNEVFRLKNSMSTTCFLLKFDTNLRILKYAKFSMGRYTNNLRNEHQFYATLSEIDFVTPFVTNYKVELEPKINSKRLDAKIDIDAQTLYVEIISPNRFKPLERLSGVMKDIPNRIKGKIYDEFKDQLIEVDSIGQPVIVAIDIGNSEVDYDFIEDYIFGTLKFTWYFDNTTHETVGSEVKRDETESMHQLASEMDLISAIICYKTRLYDDLTYRTEGKIFHNPHARVPLSRNVSKTIEENLFSRDLD